MKNDRILTRRARAGDAESLASLAAQLGYPAEVAVVSEQLSMLTEDDRQTVIVAELCGGIAGWIHVAARRLLYAPLHGEISGLIVDEKLRRRGIGRALTGAAEDWAAGAGCGKIIVRSNAVRKEAHDFYPGMGYHPVKTSKVYGKELQ